VRVPQTFGALLREVRLAHGLTQSDLTGPGISASYVSLLEHGKREPTAHVLAQLAARLGVDVADLTPVPAPAALPDETRWRLSGAELALVNGEPAYARAEFAALVQVAGLPAVWGLARSSEALGDLEAALAEFHAAADLADELHETLRALDARIALARCYFSTRDELRAIAVLETALALVHTSGLSGSDQHAQALSSLMGCHTSLGQLGEATRIAAVLLDLVESGGTWRARGSAYWNAALVAEAAGDLSAATAYADRAVALFSEGDDERSLARVSAACAWFWLRHPDGPDRLDDIERMLLDARETLQQCGTQGDIANAETELARVALLRATPDDALAWADSAIERLGLEARAQTPDALLARGEALWMSGDVAAALATADTVEMTLQSMPQTREAAHTWRGLAELWNRLDRTDQAFRALERALDAHAVHASPMPRLPAQPWVARHHSSDA
jgi:transcriptional regulator with XRE-family HTH domain